MNHIHLYTDLFLANHRHPEPDSDKSIHELQTMISSRGHGFLTYNKIRNALLDKPKPSQLIPELMSRGYKAKYVADLLKTSTANVSYHKNNPSIRPYENTVFLYEFEQVYKFKKGKHVIYRPVIQNND